MNLLTCFMRIFQQIFNSQHQLRCDARVVRILNHQLLSWMGSLMNRESFRAVVKTFKGIHTQLSLSIWRKIMVCHQEMITVLSLNNPTKWIKVLQIYSKKGNLFLCNSSNKCVFVVCSIQEYFIQDYRLLLSLKDLNDFEENIVCRM